jgi:phenylacetaldehyde dehydrogenase
MMLREKYGVTLSEATTQFLIKPKQLLIGGKWVNASGGAAFPTEDPADGSVLTEVPNAGPEDVNAAVAAARRAFESPEWSAMRPVARERLLLKLADLVEADAQTLAEIESLDNGKSVVMARHVDVAFTIDLFRYMAGWATKLEGTTLDVSLPLVPDAQFQAWTRREPVGVVGAIVPWNFPLALTAAKLGPALATGCTVVVKPAEQTSLSALRLGELILQAGFPPGVVNIVTGSGHITGAALSAHPGVDKVAFTGSTAVGKLIGKSALENMTRFSLELGGKSPVIVLQDMDPVRAAQGAAQAIFFNSGQICTGGSRLYVQKSRFDDVLHEMGKIAAAMRLGPGLRPDTELGPLISERQRRRVLDYIELGRAAGARVVAGGGATTQKAGYFVAPTVMTGLDEQHSMVSEEIFGPVVAAMSFDDLDEVAARANATVYGLSASIWSNNLMAVHTLLPKIKAGTVWVNCHNLLDPALPFGGYKQSGFGREMGRAVLDLYTEQKSVCMQL